MWEWYEAAGKDFTRLVLMRARWAKRGWGKYKPGSLSGYLFVSVFLATFSPWEILIHPSSVSGPRSEIFRIHFTFDKSHEQQSPFRSGRLFVSPAIAHCVADSHVCRDHQTIRWDPILFDLLHFFWFLLFFITLFQLLPRSFLRTPSLLFFLFSPFLLFFPFFLGFWLRDLFLARNPVAQIYRICNPVSGIQVFLHHPQPFWGYRLAVRQHRWYY